MGKLQIKPNLLRLLLFSENEEVFGLGNSYTAIFIENIIAFRKRRSIWMGKLQIQPNLIIILLFSENGDVFEWGTPNTA